MTASLSDLMLRFLAGPPLLRGHNPLSVALKNRWEHFCLYQGWSRATIRNGNRIQLTANRPKQNTASAGSTWRLFQSPPPNISTEIPPLFRKIFDIFRGIPKDVFIHSRFLVYTPTMVCTSLGFHGTLVGKHWCTLQESYAYAISVAVQKGVSDIRMHA
jgi:hypothetical protein